MIDYLKQLEERLYSILFSRHLNFHTELCFQEQLDSLVWRFNAKISQIIEFLSYKCNMVGMLGDKKLKVKTKSAFKHIVIRGREIEIERENGVGRR